MPNRKLEFNPPSGPLPGLDFRDQLFEMLERLASNGLGTNLPEDLKDGEFYYQTDTPNIGERTLFIKQCDNSLATILTLRSDGTVIFSEKASVNINSPNNTGILPISNGGTGRTDGKATGVTFQKNNDINIDTFTAQGATGAFFHTLDNNAQGTFPEDITVSGFFNVFNMGFVNNADERDLGCNGQLLIMGTYAGKPTNSFVYYRPRMIGSQGVLEWGQWKNVIFSGDVIPISDGGTGAVTADGARGNISAAHVDHMHNSIANPNPTGFDYTNNPGFSHLDPYQQFSACISNGISWDFTENRDPAITHLPAWHCFLLTFKRSNTRGFQLCFGWTENRRWTRRLHDDSGQGIWGPWREF